MFNGGKKYNLTFKIIASIIIQVFLVTDIAWASGGDLSWAKPIKTESSRLAPTVNINQNNVREAISMHMQLRRMADAFEQLTDLKPTSEVPQQIIAQRIQRLLKKFSKNTQPITIVEGCLLTPYNGSYLCVYSADIAEKPEFLKNTDEQVMPSGNYSNLKFSLIDKRKYDNWQEARQLTLEAGKGSQKKTTLDTQPSRSGLSRMSLVAGLLGIGIVLSIFGLPILAGASIGVPAFAETISLAALLSNFNIVQAAAMLLPFGFYYWQKSIAGNLALPWTQPKTTKLKLVSQPEEKPILEQKPVISSTPKARANILSTIFPKELIRKIAVTVVVGSVALGGFFVPLPEFFGSSGLSLAGYNLLPQAINDILTTFSSGGIKYFNIQFGMFSYIISNILLGAASLKIPYFKRLTKEQGESGQRILKSYKRWSAVAISLVAALVSGITVSKMGIIAFFMFNPAGLAAGLLALGLGTYWLVTLSEKITEKGIASGFTVIITAGFMYKLIPTAALLITTAGIYGWLFLGGLGVIAIAALGLSLFAKEIIVKRETEFQSEQTSTRKINLGIKWDYMGLQAIIIVSAFLGIITSIFNIPVTAGLMTNPWVAVPYVLAIIAISLIATFVHVNPQEAAENVKKSRFYIPNIREGMDTARYIWRVQFWRTLLGGAIIAVATLMPRFLADYLNLGDINMGGIIGGTGIFISVTLGVEIFRKWRAEVTAARRLKVSVTEQNAIASEPAAKDYSWIKKISGFTLFAGITYALSQIFGVQYNETQTLGVYIMEYIMPWLVVAGTALGIIARYTLHFTYSLKRKLISKPARRELSDSQEQMVKQAISSALEIKQRDDLTDKQRQEELKSALDNNNIKLIEGQFSPSRALLDKIILTQGDLDKEKIVILRLNDLSEFTQADISSEEMKWLIETLLTTYGDSKIVFVEDEAGLNKQQKALAAKIYSLINQYNPQSHKIPGYIYNSQSAENKLRRSRARTWIFTRDISQYLKLWLRQQRLVFSHKRMWKNLVQFADTADRVDELRNEFAGYSDPQRLELAHQLRSYFKGMSSAQCRQEINSGLFESRKFNQKEYLIKEVAIALAAAAITKKSGYSLQRNQIVGALALSEVKQPRKGLAKFWHDLFTPEEAQYDIKGNYIKMKTGEGKTETAAMALFLQSIAGKGAHLLTPNPKLAADQGKDTAGYLARLGISVGIIGDDNEEGTPNVEMYEHGKLYHGEQLTITNAFNCEITYCTEHAANFAYQTKQMQRAPFSGIYDEGDVPLGVQSTTPRDIQAQTEDDMLDWLRGLDPDKKDKLLKLLRTSLIKLTENSDSYNLTLAKDKKPGQITLTPEGINLLKPLLKGWAVSWQGERQDWENNPQNFINRFGYTFILKILAGIVVKNLEIGKDCKLNFVKQEYKITEKGWTKINSGLLGITKEQTYNDSGELAYLVGSALRARFFFQKAKKHEKDNIEVLPGISEYAVENRKVVPLSKETGYPLRGNEISEGIHQALEINAFLEGEAVDFTQEKPIASRLTIQQYARLYTLR